MAAWDAEPGHHVQIVIPGDANFDGKVSDIDAAIVATYWQYEGPNEIDWRCGDFNSDGEVTDADAAILATHWQEGVGEGAAPVPEPTIPIALLSMAVVGVVAYVWRGRRERKPLTAKYLQRRTGSHL